MKKLRVELGERSYDILFERGLAARAGEFVRSRGGKVFVVTDSNVAPLYLGAVVRSLQGAGLEVRSVTLPAGEKTKSFSSLPALYSLALSFGLTRADTVVTLGGGVIGDLGGFFAASYMRGVSFVQMPTSLLAQVDSSVGGKVGVDLPEGKNLVGAFHQPACVLIDPDTLKTLPDVFIADGMGEVIKYGCIKDRELFERLEGINGSKEKLFEHIEEIIFSCVDIKREIVEKDEKESGERKLLNFGHTYGHALEKLNHFEISHGLAVAAGMREVTLISQRRGQTQAGCAERIERVCRAFGLNTDIKADRDAIVAAMRNDKKSSGKGLDIVLLKDIGSAFVYPASPEYFRS